MESEFDVIVVGAGPAGSTTAAFLGKMGHKVLLVDKARFPRDKTCGDAISGSLNTLEELGLAPRIEKSPHAKIRRIVFSSPNAKTLSINFKGMGYCCRREVYDNLVFQKAKENCTVMEEFNVTDLVVKGGFVKGIKGTSKGGLEQEFAAKVIVGADGAHSVVAKQTGLLDLDPRHTLTAVRCYYRNVKETNDAIELHFVDDIIPGYFWVFPLEDDLANVGIGMVLEDFKKKKWKMTDKMFEIIEHHPLFKKRFAGSELVTGTVKGWTLPVGSKRRKAHGNGFILAGDAAGLIDAFTGEGISNGMRCGQIASKWVDSAIKANDFSKDFFSQYEDDVWQALGDKLQTSYKLQKLGRHKFLVNMVIDKASRSKQIQDTLREMMDNSERRKNLANPLFYLKLIFS